MARIWTAKQKIDLPNPPKQLRGAVDEAEEKAIEASLKKLDNLQAKLNKKVC